MKVLIIFGDMEFNDNICTVYSVKKTISIDSNKAENFAEKTMCENSSEIDSYVIPEMYKGKIIYKCEKL